MSKKLTRSHNKAIAGVCAGFAEYIGMDISLTRLIFAILIIFGGLSAWVYLIAWIIMPDADNYTEY